MQQQPPEQNGQPELINPQHSPEGNPAGPELVPPVRGVGHQGAGPGEGQLVPPAQSVQRPAPSVPQNTPSIEPPHVPSQPVRPNAANAAGLPREPAGEMAPAQPERPYDHRAASSNQMSTPPVAGAAAGAAAGAGAAGMVPPARPVAPQPGGAMPANASAQSHEGRARDETASRVVTLSSLMHLPVVDLGTGRRLGRVDNIILSSDHRSVEAYTSNGGFLSGTKAFPARGATIGQDAIVLPPGALERFDKRSLRGLPLAGPVTGTRLLSDTGRVLGTVTDIRMDPATAEVVGYEVNPEDRSLLDRLRHRGAVLPVAAVQRRGSDAWIVAEDDARQHLGG